MALSQCPSPAEQRASSERLQNPAGLDQKLEGLSNQSRENFRRLLGREAEFFDEEAKQIINSGQLTPELQKTLFDALKDRFENKPGHYRRAEGVSFENVKEALEAHPKSMLALARLEATNGEPDLIGEDEDHYILADCSKEAPRRGPSSMPYPEALKLANSLGVELIDEKTYLTLQDRGEFDQDRRTWIHTSPDEKGRIAWVKVGFRDGKNKVKFDEVVNNDEAYGYLRGVVRVPKI